LIQLLYHHFVKKQMKNRKYSEKSGQVCTIRRTPDLPHKNEILSLEKHFNMMQIN